MTNSTDPGSPGEEIRPMPDGAVEPAPIPVWRSAPVPVWIACGIWLLSAVIFVVFSLLTIGHENDIVAVLRRQHPAGIDPGRYYAYAHSAILVSVTVGILFAALYVFFGWFVLAGKNWARIVVTIFTVIGVLYDLYAGGSWSTYVGLLIGVVAVVLVYLPASRAHFARGRVTGS